MRSNQGWANSHILVGGVLMGIHEGTRDSGLNFYRWEPFSTYRGDVVAFDVASRIGAHSLLYINRPSCRNYKPNEMEATQLTPPARKTPTTRYENCAPASAP